ncbi:flagellar brake protein [Cellulomonas telluris]|uniref:flagellar brake protein n=1 Tax=Cellulomonas telluris TaxID=2306636 RepID=UPI0010A889A4|nr:PilZ domain-containing protein [Cellulomonas telluris]
MHDLARCVLTIGEGTLDGHVATHVDGMLTFAPEHGLVGGIQVGDGVGVLVLDEVRGEVRYTGWVTHVGAMTVQVEHLELVSTMQKRRSARVRVTQICTGLVRSPDGGTREVTFVVVDVSAHGVRVSTTAGMDLHDRVRFTFPTPERPVALEAEVVRVQETTTGTTHYGCRFVALDERDEDLLFRYVLRTQGEQRRSRVRD